MSSPPSVSALLERLAARLEGYLKEEDRQDPAMIGIHTGGVWVAQHLHRALGVRAPLGTLSINFYRDDFTRIGMHPRVRPSHLPFAVDDRHIVLIDDVLHTGRTVRAGLNEIFDYGRPASVTLGVLVERSGREIPVQPDARGETMRLSQDHYVKLVGPEPLELVVQGPART